MNRFFVDYPLVSDSFFIDGDNFKHINNVLRMQIGEKIEICQFGACYLCEIDSINKKDLTAKVVKKYEHTNELKAKIRIFQGLPKKDKMELVITKCIELGVDEIFPVHMDRSIVKYDNKKKKNKITRWLKLALSASMQSKRDKVVSIGDIKTLKAYENELKDCDKLIVLYENDSQYGSLKTFLSSIEKYDTINVVIGPEGGISEAEIEYLLSIGASTMSLGRRILRTETAGLAFMSCASVFLED